MQTAKAFPAEFLLWILIVLSVAGCAVKPYQYTAGLEGPLTLELQESEPQIERGRPVAIVDGLGHYFFSIPSKLVLLNWDIDNHHISTSTEEAISTYLADNDLKNVKVRLNQYSPGGEWKRLVFNSDMPGFFRFTLGVLATSFYTIFPGRLFGGDNYNPYTNTINLYSDHAAVALHEAAHAKDFVGRSRGFKGWYSAMRILPLMPLYQEGKASGDAIGYTIEREMTETEADAYKTLYPAYMTYVAGEGLRWVPVEPWVSLGIQFAVALPGHLVGNIKAAMQDDPQKSPSVEKESPPTDL
ncbi:MAG: hypothetical protein KKG47_09760 [Proteobacteria bacterium]|nr:hypothetical protein [Pseudomonadota bacterium]MBU1736559.1 hypothetical protein [Pseudomonadota bacterium]